jgi:ribonuclease R
MPTLFPPTHSSNLTGLPDRDALLEILKNADEPQDKRTLARRFGLNGAEKIALKALLKTLVEDGTLVRNQDRSFRLSTALPNVGVIIVSHINSEGELWGRYENAAEAPAIQNLDAVRIRIYEKNNRSSSAKTHRRVAALGLGDRLLARLEAVSPHSYRAHMLKKLEARAEPLLGVLRSDGSDFWLDPVDKRQRMAHKIARADALEAQPGELVQAEQVGRNLHRREGRARVVARLGTPLAPKSFALIAIAQHAIPTQFSPEALKQAQISAAQPLEDQSTAREDLRRLPLLTIDPKDARDHDDAIWAQPDPDPKNPGGFQAVVAIADVSYYVRSQSLLDEEARTRGNSTYFPDGVVPMLPEILSSTMCSLKPEVERACLACHLTIDAHGGVIASRFTRGVMRSIANLTYEQAQAVFDNDPAVTIAPNVKAALLALWQAWQALKTARDARAPLALHLPERRIELDSKGKIVGVNVKIPLPAHQLIEDFMIAANVAAAHVLERAQMPVVYRVHEPPAREKLVALKEMLETVNQPFALGQSVRPALFNQLLARVADQDTAALVQEMVLRSQTQAYYTIKPLGHFGLNLNSYAHFTSPIRRYSDVLVHRALVQACKLGVGALTTQERAHLEKTATHISATERRSMAAERETIERYVASYLSDKVGMQFNARINGVTRSGLFVTLEDIGGDGLIPLSTLGDERFIHDSAAATLTGQLTGTLYRLGMRVLVRLEEAAPITGGLRFSLLEGAGVHAQTPKKRSAKTLERGKHSNRFKRKASAQRYQERC